MDEYIDFEQGSRVGVTHSCGGFLSEKASFRPTSHFPILQAAPTPFLGIRDNLF